MMRIHLIAVFAAFLLAVVAGQNSLLQSTQAERNPSAITACAVQGGSCAQPPLDSSPGSIVLEHVVFSKGCYSSDLHVVRYVPVDSVDGEPVVAQWCS
jgi:hypothetical protein